VCSSLGYCHRKDHPDQQAADDVLQSLADNDYDKGNWINHERS